MVETLSKSSSMISACIYSSEDEEEKKKRAPKWPPPLTDVPMPEKVEQVCPWGEGGPQEGPTQIR